MDTHARAPIDGRLLDDFQRDLPLEPRPYAIIARKLGCSEGDVLSRLRALQATGVVARVGGVVRPNTLGASTLAAIAVPELETDAIAEIIAAEPGVNHVYLRENDWNLWFVATGPDQQAVAASLKRIAQRTRRRVLDLRLEQPYHIDLGFSMGSGGPRITHRCTGKPSVDYAPHEGDAELVQELMNGLPLVEHPFQEIGRMLNRTENDVIARIGELVDAGVLPRVGVIVRHRALGWRSNAMVVFDVPPEKVDEAGHVLASIPGINLCYRRRRYATEWPFNLYCMVHARTRVEALETLTDATSIANLDDYPRKILFSLRCYKQTGAMITRARVAA